MSLLRLLLLALALVAVPGVQGTCPVPADLKREDGTRTCAKLYDKSEWQSVAVTFLLSAEECGVKVAGSEERALILFPIQTKTASVRTVTSLPWGGTGRAGSSDSDSGRGRYPEGDAVKQGGERHPETETGRGWDAQGDAGGGRDARTWRCGAGQRDAGTDTGQERKREG
uniref:Uncharacterized protein n=1 Tax=Spermophilus dauricus TaxID=99837 RepID=A0A8C9NY42_SPEDA